MFAIGCKVVVKTSEEDIIVEADGGAKTIADVIELVANGGVVAPQSSVGFLKITQHVRAGADTEGIQFLDIVSPLSVVGTKCKKTSGIVVGRSAYSFNTATGG